MVKPSIDFEHLSLAERIQLVEDLWDSIAGHPEAVPLTDSQVAEVRRRLAAHDQDPGSAVPWDEMRARLYGQTGRRGG